MAPNIICRKSWELNGLEETPESAFLNRRQLMAGMGAMAAIGGMGGFSAS
ncbi:MAG: hypothetical protein GY761_07430, partial [Hyphomicrobiales bacterium]|nr:hypothetical protein [Hyphomicrobiales bacterium]